MLIAAALNSRVFILVIAAVDELLRAGRHVVQIVQTGQIVETGKLLLLLRVLKKRFVCACRCHWKQHRTSILCLKVRLA